MKKWIIGLSLIFALGMVSCTGKKVESDKKEIKKENCTSTCEDTKCKCTEADCTCKCKEAKDKKN
jgi:hypothetical protein